MFVAAGRPRRLQGPLGLSGAPPPLSCSVSRGAHRRLQPLEAGGGQKEAGGSSVAAAQHLLDRVRGPGPLNAARGHEQPSPKVACPSDPSRPQGERAGQPPAHVRHLRASCPRGPRPPLAVRTWSPGRGALGGRRVDLARGTLPGGTREYDREAEAAERGLGVAGGAGTFHQLRGSLGGGLLLQSAVPDS